MNQTAVLRPLERLLRFFAVLTVVLVPTQILGLSVYLGQAWSRLQATLPQPLLLLLGTALLAGFIRSGVWILIYWNGARALRVLRNPGDSARLLPTLAPILRLLTRLLVLSCLLDVVFLPAYFWNEVTLPVWFSGWRLGLVELARVLFPQAIGMAALILAFLTHQYGQLLAERVELKSELELTV